ncbi:MAG: hypothetical protein A3I05_03635 [Deltaproteobacteria bacterium RIFCSPLOWO2_02_FULL_44_10]|nr:MAG: hypothetical protein A3C46_03205 [Deltaproteobacteria bacterium RIFCSPHIGHO2_02_FULL_44_16]OGQ46267.1 MAG: hypothetical protein A3I05_03635 [Deltaproteobacteria bacterium RIFCSPLOWO2_02_FULL_44_10]
MSDNLKACFAEFFATFLLVFVGVGSIIMNTSTNGSIGLIGIALAHGLAIFLGCAITGHISGAHINPAVTAAMLATRRIGFGLGLAYIASQLLGALFGASLLNYAMPLTAAKAAFYGTPMLADGVSFQQGIFLEAVLTFILVLSIFGSAVDARGPKSISSLVIGLAITADIFVGGPITGAAMNPARAFGPAIMSGIFTNHAVYWIGPMIGGILGGIVYERMLKKN